MPRRQGAAGPPALRSTRGSSDTAIVAFSARGVYPTRFHFLGLDRHFPDATRILLRDLSDSWYNAGLPGVGGTVDEIAGRIEEEIAGAGAERVLTVGSSMGGYAAILFGCLIGAERTIALGPQTLLDPELPERAPAPDLQLHVADLEPVIAAAPQTRVEMVVAWDDLLDVFHAQRVAAHDSVRVLAVRGAEHEFARQLLARGAFWPLMSELVEGRTPAICKVDPALDPDDVERIGEAARAHCRGDLTAAIAALAPVAKRYPDWTAPWLVETRRHS